MRMALHRLGHSRNCEYFLVGDKTMTERRHALINDSAHVALVEIAALTKLLTEQSNREFAQRARRIAERIERVQLEFDDNGLGTA